MALLNRCFRKCGEKSGFADQIGFFDNKTAGRGSLKGGVLRRFAFFTALLKYEPTEGCSEIICATYVQQKRVVAGTATTRLSHI